jgi:hypothetical protein
VTDDLLDEDEGEESGDDSGSGGAESGAGGDPKSSEKRISDLQSKADKETARANKAETELARLKSALADEDAGAGAPPPSGGAPAGDATVLDMARMFVYAQHPKLEEYGVPASDLTGSNPNEIAQSAADLAAQVEKIETKARNKMLAENGMAPEIDGGSPPPPPRDFSKMSSEDFAKLMAEHGVK